MIITYTEIWSKLSKKIPSNATINNLSATKSKDLFTFEQV